MMADDDKDVPLDPDLAAEALEADIDPEEEDAVEGPLLDAFGAPLDE
jgi:hypothetical protein